MRRFRIFLPVKLTAAETEAGGFLLLVLTALGIRLVCLCFSRNYVISRDAVVYLQMAESIVRSNGLLSHYDSQTPWLYPYCIYLLTRLHLAPLAAGYAVSLIAGSFCAGIVFLICRALDLSIRFAWRGGLLVCFAPWLVSLSCDVLRDSLFLFFMLLFFLFAILFFRHGSFPYLPALALSGVFGSFTRYEMIVLCLLFALFAFRKKIVYPFCFLVLTILLAAGLVSVLDYSFFYTNLQTYLEIHLQK